MSASQSDPQIATLLQQLKQRGAPPLHRLTPRQARQEVDALITELGQPPPPIFRVTQQEIPGPGGALPIRVYTPPGKGPFPLLLFFHGGGWVLGSLDTHDSICRALAHGGPCVVVAPAYRLAPEYKFPAAVEDAYAALCWAAAHAGAVNGDPARLAVGGDSAGGNLAAVVSLLARDRQGPIPKFQLLVYPIVNVTAFETDQYREEDRGYLLRQADLLWCRAHYLTHLAEGQSPYVSPLLAATLAGLPAALIITAGLDLLTPEAAAYAKRLRQAGVSVQYTCYPGMPHMFFSITRLNKASAAMAEATTALQNF